MDASEFLDKPTKNKLQPYYVLSGDEDFLKRLVIHQLQEIILGDSEPEYSLTTYTGDKADFSTVRNELFSGSFFSERRMVVVNQAESFVSENRPQLEKYADAPASTGILVLDVKSFPATTNLAKKTPKDAHIICKAPPSYRLPMWCTIWCQTRYGKKLTNPGAQMLVDLVGTSMGILDQELQKLKQFVGSRPAIDAPDVDELVGKSREANVFKILDAIGLGKTDVALQILGELFEQGKDPLMVMGALGFQLRKLGRIWRLHQQGNSIDDAMGKAGVPNFPDARNSTRQQLKHLGRSRLDKLYDWLLELDSGLKGGNPLPMKMQVERLVVKLGQTRAG